MMRWEKFAVIEEVDDKGTLLEKTIRYRAKGCGPFIESVKRAIKHANGIGVWYYTDYTVWYPDGASRVFNRLRDAQAEAESYGGKNGRDREH